MGYSRGDLPGNRSLNPAMRMDSYHTSHSYPILIHFVPIYISICWCLLAGPVKSTVSSRTPNGSPLCSLPHGLNSSFDKEPASKAVPSPTPSALHSTPGQIGNKPVACLKKKCVFCKRKQYVLSKSRRILIRFWYFRLHCLLFNIPRCSVPDALYLILSVFPGIF